MRNDPTKRRVFWLIPIRFWETDEYAPERVEVVEWSQCSKRHLYGHCDRYGHEVYVERRKCFPSWIAARREQHRRAALDRLARADEWDRHWRGVVRPMVERRASFDEILEALIAR